MKKEQNETFFVSLESPLEVQRSLLECTKNVLSGLKRYESFRNIRKYKVEYLMQLKHVMGELNLLNNRLRRALPKTGLRAVGKKKKEKTESKKQPKKFTPKEKTDIQKLESDLSDIESKLKSIK